SDLSRLSAQMCHLPPATCDVSDVHPPLPSPQCLFIATHVSRRHGHRWFQLALLLVLHCAFGTFCLSDLLTDYTHTHTLTHQPTDYTLTQTHTHTHTPACRLHTHTHTSLQTTHTRPHTHPTLTTRQHRR